MKTCTKCYSSKELSEFNKNKNNADGHSTWCRQCMKDAYSPAHYKKYVKKNPQVHRKSHLKLKYLLTPEEYESMLHDQQEGCAICGAQQEDIGKRLLVDHDHETGKVRGLLCPSCNHGLGRFRDDPELLSRAKDYIERSLCG